MIYALTPGEYHCMLELSRLVATHIGTLACIVIVYCFWYILDYQAYNCLVKVIDNAYMQNRYVCVNKHIL